MCFYGWALLLFVPIRGHLCLKLTATTATRMLRNDKRDIEFTAPAQPPSRKCSICQSKHNAPLSNECGGVGKLRGTPSGNKGKAGNRSIANRTGRRRAFYNTIPLLPLNCALLKGLIRSACGRKQKGRKQFKIGTKQLGKAHR